jgi:hypothetical protein
MPVKQPGGGVDGRAAVARAVAAVLQRAGAAVNISAFRRATGRRRVRPRNTGGGKCNACDGATPAPS